MKGEIKSSHFSFFLMGSFLVISGVSGCGESATGPENPPTVTGQAPNANSPTGNIPTDVPDDLSGTNLAPPPAPPGN